MQRFFFVVEATHVQTCVAVPLMKKAKEKKYFFKRHSCASAVTCSYHSTAGSLARRFVLEAYFRECKARGITDQQAEAKLKDVVDAALVERQAQGAKPGLIFVVGGHSIPEIALSGAGASVA